MAAIDRIDEHLTCGLPNDNGVACPLPNGHKGFCPRGSRIEDAGRDVAAAMKALRWAEKLQRDLESESFRHVPNVTQDEIEAAGKRVKAARLTFLAALAVLEKEVDR